MTVDVEANLAAYGRWLEDHVGVQMRAPTADPTEGMSSTKLDRQTIEVSVSERTRRPKRPMAWIAVAATVVMVVAGLVFVRDRRPPPAADQPSVDLGPVSEFPGGTATAIDEPLLFVVNDLDAGFMVFDVRSPHLGCRLVRRDDLPDGDDSTANPGVEFVDPCHGSAFDLEGRKLAGPAPRDMDRYEFQIRDGHVIADLSERIPGTPAPGGSLAPLDTVQEGQGTSAALPDG